MRVYATALSLTLALALTTLALPPQAPPIPPQAPGQPTVCPSDCAPMPPPAPHLPGKNCKCGCVETGKCNCKDCDHPKGADPRPPNPNCQCGCTKTGKCDCKDCDHPLLKPKEAKPKGPSPRPDGLGYCSNLCTCGCQIGSGCVCGSPNRREASDPYYTRSLPVQSTHYPAQPYPPSYSFSSGRASGGGSCRGGG